jgi:hypothetical protein
MISQHSAVRDWIPAFAGMTGGAGVRAFEDIAMPASPTPEAWVQVRH